MAKSKIITVGPNIARELPGMVRAFKAKQGNANAVTPYAEDIADLWLEVIANHDDGSSVDRFKYDVKLYLSPFVVVAKAVPSAGTAGTGTIIGLNTYEVLNTSGVRSAWTLDAMSEAAAVCGDIFGIEPAPTAVRFKVTGFYKHPTLGFAYAFTHRNDPKIKGPDP